MLYVLFRLFMIIIGLVAGALAAGVALMLIEVWGMPVPSDIPVAEARFALVINALIVSGLALFYACLPGALFGFAAEIFRLRSILWFAAIGGLIGLLPAYGYLPSWVDVNFSGPPLTNMPLKAYPAVGIIGGCMYWLLTGCKAGFLPDDGSAVNAARGEDRG
mgnify:CR=1 FL=1